MSTTEGMKGGGYYDDHSEYQRQVAHTGTGLIERAVAALPPPATGRPVVLVDYGSATGGNSVVALRTAVVAVRDRWPEVAVAVVHNDLPSNDWNELFANLTAAPESYLGLPGPPVVPMASATSFFGPAVPSASVHLGTSFSAVHWLSAQPRVPVPGGFYFCEATGAARRQLAEQAEADWTRFLGARALDLAPGGRLVLQMVGSEPAPGSGEPAVTARRLLRAMAEVAQQMADDRELEQQAVDDYLLAVYARTVEEARRPLERPGSSLAAEFVLEECRTDPVSNPYLARWRADRDAAAYGSAYAAFARGFTESSLRQHLIATLGTARGGRRAPQRLLRPPGDALRRRSGAGRL